MNLMRNLLPSLIICLFSIAAFGQADDPTPEQLEFLEHMATDSIQGKVGGVYLDVANCAINVPPGFVFLEPAASRHLLVDYWDNPEERLDGILGTLVKEDAGIFYNVGTAYVISYDNAGYVSDQDATGIDYDELLENMQQAVREENRNNPNGQTWELLGWGWPPTYDQEKKVLAWSRHYRIDGEHEVINYDVRVLGKAGFVVITAVASPDAKGELMADNDAIVNSISYNRGYKYSDFDPETDHVAEWTIGSLIAGKVLAKAGIWAILAKFSKLIIVAIIGFFLAIGKRVARWFRLRKDEDENYVEMD